MSLEGLRRNKSGFPLSVNQHTLIIARTAPLDTPVSPSAATETINTEKKSYEGEALDFPGATPPPTRPADSAASDPDPVAKLAAAVLEREEPREQVINTEKKSYDSPPLSFAPKPEEIRKSVEDAPRLPPIMKVETAADLTLDSLIAHAAHLKASDLFIKAGSPPAFKCMNRVVVGDYPVLTPEDSKRLSYEHMHEKHIEWFELHHELNISFTVANAARIRQNVYCQRTSVACCCRLIPFEVKSLADLGITSKAIMNLTREVNGLVLVTGPTGCGKTTTLASIIDNINDTRPVNIITIEDPIEFLHRDKMGIVSQREVGVDTDSFGESLKQVLRQAPDVILIGELRDLETLNVALQAAETGHLVFATLHTASAAETLDRISNMYPPSEREMLWLRLSVSLKGVVSQKLCRKADGSGRILAMEILVATPTISKQLEDGRSEDLYAAVRSDGEEDFWGMRTMNQCLEEFYRDNLITEEEALLHAGNLAELKQALRRATVDKDFAEKK